MAQEEIVNKSGQLYKYKALKEDGRTSHGTLMAKSEAHLYEQLASVKMELLTCTAVKQRAEGFFSRKARITIRDKVQFYTQLEQMQMAGIPFIEVLNNCRQSLSNPTFRDVVNEIYRMISEGLSLSEAMEQFPRVFTAFEVAILAAMEKTGDMTSGYRYLIEHLTWAEAMQSRIKKATRYPMILAVVLVAVVVIMMVFVVPQIIGFVSEIQGETSLPIYTIALMWTSDLFQNYWWLMIGVLVTVISVFIGFRRVSDNFKYKTDGMFLRAPLIGELLRKIEVARFCHTVGALFAASISILDCLKSAANTVDNLVIKEAVEEIHKKVSDGQAMHVAMQETNEFENMVIQMVKVGEETGNMTHVLEQVKKFYNKDVDETIEAMIAMIEPGMTMILGGIILWIAVAVFGPIYSMFDKMIM